MKPMILASTTLLAASLAATSLPASADDLKIDGSTPQAFSRSLKAIGDSLEPDEREAYKRGLMNLVLTNYPPAAKADGAALVTQISPALQAARSTLNGMSKEEIVAKGRDLMKNPLPRAR